MWGWPLFGIEPADTGVVNFAGKEEKIHASEQALKLGIAYVTEDRRQFGLTMPMSIVSNISLPMLRNYLSRLGLLKQSE